MMRPILSYCRPPVGTLTIFLIVVCSIVQAQLPCRTVTAAMYSGQLEQLREEFGKNKSLQKEFELPLLIALSKYPELRDIRIQVVYGKIKTTMAARPKLGAVFMPKAKRCYRVVINSKEEKLRQAALKNLPFNAQVGVLAHEFPHIRLYNTKNIFGLIGIGIGYSVSKRFRQEFEKENDRETIARGYGWQIYHFTSYILKETDLSEKYKKYKERIYYTPDELEKIINHH